MGIEECGWQLRLEVTADAPAPTTFTHGHKDGGGVALTLSSAAISGQLLTPDTFPGPEPGVSSCEVAGN